MRAALSVNQNLSIKRYAPPGCALLRAACPAASPDRGTPGGSAFETSLLPGKTIPWHRRSQTAGPLSSSVPSPSAHCRICFLKYSSKEMASPEPPPPPSPPGILPYRPRHGTEAAPVPPNALSQAKSGAPHCVRGPLRDYSVTPPSTLKLIPVIKPTSSLARNTMAAANSSGRPRRPMG